MKKVYSAQHPTEAHLVKGILESHGVSAKVRGEALFGARGELPVTVETAPSVWIEDEKQFDLAKGIVKEYEKANAQKLPQEKSWVCTSCGEECEGQFTVCWNCGKTQ